MFPQILTNPNNHPTIPLNSFNSSGLPFRQTIFECLTSPPPSESSDDHHLGTVRSFKPETFLPRSFRPDGRISKVRESSFFRHESDIADSTRLSPKLHRALDAQTKDGGDFTFEDGIVPQVVRAFPLSSWVSQKNIEKWEYPIIQRILLLLPPIKVFFISAYLDLLFRRLKSIGYLDTLYPKHCDDPFFFPTTCYLMQPC
jgi:hypothetical protein